MSRKTGRNDPCPCGSGKKYKRCHLPIDEAADRSRPSSNPDNLRVSPLEIARALNDLPDSSDPTLREVKRRLIPLIAFSENKDRIDAACQALETHRAEFLAFSQNAKAFAEKAESLFAEEPFGPFHFTAADIRRAFEAVGYPTRFDPDDEKFFQNLEQAILFLADEDRRAGMSLGLLSLIPQYIDSSRPLDAWIIQYAALDTAENTSEPNAFLFQMFSHGYDAWQAERSAHRQTLLNQLGWDPERLQSLSPTELESWLASQRADPQKAQAVAALFNSHPETAAMAAELERLENEGIELLKRDDSTPLYFSIDELNPWLSGLVERLQTASQQSDSNPNANQEIVTPYIEQILQSFPSERWAKLATDLRTYASVLRSSGCTKEALAANSIALQLETENRPSQNPFLYSLCVHSFRYYSENASADAPEPSAHSQLTLPFSELQNDLA